MYYCVQQVEQLLTSQTELVPAA